MRRALPWLLVGAVALAWGCDDDDPTPTQTPTNNGQDDQDVSADTTPEDTGDDAPDTSPDVPPDVPRPDPGTPVEIDYADHLARSPNPAGGVRVFVAEREDQLIGGPAAQGRVGDIVMENDKVRFVIEKDDRVIGPCPFGGNIIDADIVRPAGEPGQDVIGEVCQMINAGRTLDPDSIEIVNDGSDGKPGVVAITGHLEILDFINLLGLAATFIPIEGVDFSINPDDELPLTVTLIYILRGGDQGVRVLTGLRNDGDETLHFPIAHLMDSGGEVEFFNPTSSLKGFGYSGSLDNIASVSGERTAFLGFRGERSSHMVMQDPADLPGILPASGVYLAIAGVAVHVRGVTNIASVLLTPQADVPNLPGIAHMTPGAVETFGTWHYVGDGGLSTMLDVAYGELGVETGTVSGTVAEAGGNGVEGVRVSAVNTDGRTMSQALTDATGHYTMRVPTGAYALQLHGHGHVATPVEATIAAGAPATVDLTVSTRSAVHVTITTPDGGTTPGKIVVFCDGTCPQTLTSQDRDVTFDRQLDGTWQTVFVGMSGETTIEVPPGDYRIAVSRGPEWSLWPPDARASHGSPVTVAEGETVEVTAEIARVVNSPGVVSADLHVHAINSPDSPVPKDSRVRTFLAEGVDVLVSTDHDYITDFTHTIENLGAQAELATVIGEEITTFDYGHTNAFPMELDPAARNGGAVDWAGGTGPGLTPAELFAAVHAQGGERVVQVNHPASGYFKAFGVDTLRGTTTADPTRFRLLPVEADPLTGDTGMWDEGFTAFEIYNGYSESSFWRIARWWLGMVSRGFSPTATAVSDTHKSIHDQAGGPRSLVQIGADHDAVGTFTPQAFATAVNEGRLIGTNGPGFTVVARNAGGAEATLGDTVDASDGQAVTFEVTVDVPEWLSVDTIDVFSNLPLEAIDSGNRDPDTTALAPTLSVPIVTTDADLAVVAEGTVQHRHRVVTTTFEMTFAADAYVIIIVRNKDGQDASMFPVVHSGVRPFAFANPIFVDADGGGYDHPPLADVAQQKKAVDAPDKPAPTGKRSLGREEFEGMLQGIERLHGHSK